MNHEFILLPDEGDRREQCSRFMGDARAVTLGDDLLSYFEDTLRWIPSENPMNPMQWRGHGLNWHGPTAIAGEGAQVASDIFAAWAELFSVGPPMITLTGAYEWFEEEGVGAGAYSEFSLDRAGTVARCRKIAALAAEAAKPGFWLLHQGV